MLTKLTAKQLAERVCDADKETEIKFKIADSEGWYGCKVTQIFSELQGLFAIGFYGGGETEIYDLKAKSEHESKVDFIAWALYRYTLMRGLPATFVVD